MLQNGFQARTNQEKRVGDGGQTSPDHQSVLLFEKKINRVHNNSQSSNSYRKSLRMIYQVKQGIGT